MCRQIDEVRLGSPFAKPVALHTFDCDPTLLATDGYRPSPLGSPTDLHEDDEDDDDDLYFDHPDIVRMHNVDARFMDIFRFGYKVRASVKNSLVALLCAAIQGADWRLNSSRRRISARAIGRRPSLRCSGRRSSGL